MPSLANFRCDLKSRAAARLASRPTALRFRTSCSLQSQLKPAPIGFGTWAWGNKLLYGYDESRDKEARWKSSCHSEAVGRAGVGGGFFSTSLLTRASFLQLAACFDVLAASRCRFLFDSGDR